MNTSNIIGRKAELSFLQRLYESATTYGLTQSAHNNVRNSDITLDDLF